MHTGRVVTVHFSTIQIASLGTIITGVPYRPKYSICFSMLYNGSDNTYDDTINCTLKSDGTITADKGVPNNGWFHGTVTYVYDSASS